MERFFNTAGPYRPDIHYMLPTERRLGEMPRLVQREQYFVLHAPRQTGKTTLILSFCERLNSEGRHVALYVNVEPAAADGGDVDKGMELILSAMASAAGQQLAPSCRPPIADPPNVSGTALSRALTEWTDRCALPTVLLIDEIDSLPDDTRDRAHRRTGTGLP